MLVVVQNTAEWNWDLNCNEIYSCRDKGRDHVQASTRNLERWGQTSPLSKLAGLLTTTFCTVCRDEARDYVQASMLDQLAGAITRHDSPQPGSGQVLQSADLQRSIGRP